MEQPVNPFLLNKGAAFSIIFLRVSSPLRMRLVSNNPVVHE
jgi:hypothetical protein